MFRGKGSSLGQSVYLYIHPVANHLYTNAVEFRGEFKQNSVSSFYDINSQQ